MNRNTEQHFATIPEAEIGRSKFDRSKTMKTTFNTGDIIPIYVDQTIMPGDTVKMNMGSLVRMITPIAPVMDNIWMDTYFFFVPHRLVWSDFTKFMGENDNPWKQTGTYTIPKIRLKNPNSTSTNYSKIEAGSLLNYMGIPIGLGQISTTSNDQCISISHLPIRAYIKIWNDWFRDQNTENNIYAPIGSGVQSIVSYSYAKGQSDPYLYVNNGAICAKANRMHDYFSSALPEPQKGPATLVPLVGSAPIKSHTYQANSHTADEPIVITTNANGEASYIYATDGEVPSLNTIVRQSADMYPYADLENAVGATVNAIRQAFAIQKFYERQARGGWACALASS